MAGRLQNTSRERLKAWDGWVLDLEICYPRGSSKGVVICGHAMMTDRRSLLRDPRPSVARTLCESGFTVVVPDLRGHGMSGPTPASGGEWSYDDHVRDVGVLIDYATSLSMGASVALVGHSLFGHAALAWLARTPDAVETVSAVVLLAVNLWHPDSWGAPQPRRMRLTKALAMRAARALGRPWGYLPVARAVPRSMDESASYWETLYRCATDGRWLADDGFDYRAALDVIRCPVLHVVSEGDPVYGNPDEAERFVAPLPRRTVWRLGTRRCPEPLWSLKPDHMALVTRSASQPVWEHLAQWLQAPYVEADG